MFPFILAVLFLGSQSWAIVSKSHSGSSSHSGLAAEQHHHGRRTLMAPSIEETRQAIQSDSVWIVELDEMADVEALDDLKKRGIHPKSHSSIAHQSFNRLLTATESNFTIQRQFTDVPTIFHGAAIKLSNDASAARVARIAGVKNIWRSRTITHPARDSLNQNMFFKRDTFSTSQKNTYNPHVMMGVDHAHRLGHYGKDIFVAVVDAGVDYKHPDLGGCFGSGCKIAYGYSFVGDSISDTAYKPKADPYATCQGAIHGTVISGLIAANASEETGFIGVAPQATLGMYRIFDCDLSSTEDMFIAGLMRAFSDGADIISLAAHVSIGGFAEDPLSVVVDRIVSQGTFVTTATGNYGEQGPLYIPAPATARGALHVGSAEPKMWTQFRTRAEDGREIDYYGSHPFTTSSSGPQDQIEVYVHSPNTSVEADGCSALSTEGTPDLSGKIALFRRGSCALVDKALNALALNATGTLVYSQPGDAVTYDDGIYEGLDSGNLGVISPEDGAYLVGLAASGYNIRLSFETGLVNSPNEESSGFSFFSQYGPTYDLRPSPSVLAPGSFILSTAPLNYGAYTVQTGTSFASPLAAGCAAVLLAVRRQQGLPSDPASLLEQITSTALPYGLDGRFQSVTQQGSGLVRLDIALSTLTLVDKCFLGLNDTRYFKGQHELQVTNHGERPLDYTVLHALTYTNFDYKQRDIYPRQEPLRYHRTANVTIAPSEFHLEPGESTSVALSFTPPSGLPFSAFPFYSGYIRFKPSHGPVFRIPYLGLDASVRDINIIDTGSKLFGFELPAIVDSLGALHYDTKTWTMEDSNNIPYLYYRLTAGTRQAYIEVVAASDTANVDPSLVTLATSSYIGRNPLDTAGHASFESTYLYSSWDGNLEDGSQVRDGDYYIRIRALKITGDREAKDDYEFWLSPIVRVQRS